MATGTLSPYFAAQFFDNNGDPLNAGTINTYLAGTTTNVATYSDSALTTPNANPIVLSSSGRCVMFLTPGVSYKFLVKDSAGSTILTQDNVSATPYSFVDLDISGTAGEAIAAGDCVILSDGSGGNTAGRWYKADADQTYLSTTPNACGFAPNAISSGSSGTIRVAGRVTGLSGLTAGTVYYASATAGALTSSAPTNARVVAVADSTTSVIVSPFLVPAGASGTQAGYVTTGAQTWAGIKTLSSAPVLSSGMTFASTQGIGNFIWARSTSNFTKNNNTTLANVTGLAFAVGASEKWIFRFVLFTSAAATASRWKFTLTGPAAPTSVAYGVMQTGTPAAAGYVTAFSSNIVSDTPATFSYAQSIEGFLDNGANAGTVQLQAAQQAADPTDNIIYANSYVVAWKVN